MKVLAILLLISTSSCLIPYLGLKDNKDEINELIGFYKGLCKTEEYKCAHVFIDNYDKVVAAFDKAEKDIEEGKDPIEVAFELAQFIRSLDGFIERCRVFEMQEIITKFLTKEGFKEFLENAIKNIDDWWEHAQKIGPARKEGKHEEEGIHAGSIFKDITGFYVD